VATRNEGVKTHKKRCGTAASNYFLCRLESLGVSPETRTDILSHLLENPLTPLHDNFVTTHDHHVTSEEEEESADEQEESADEKEESADEQTADPPSWAEDEHYFPDGITPCVEGTVSRAGLGF
jgi:hypothetical protein